MLEPFEPRHPSKARAERSAPSSATMTRQAPLAGAPFFYLHLGSVYVDDHGAGRPTLISKFATNQRTGMGFAYDEARSTHPP